MVNHLGMSPHPQTGGGSNPCEGPLIVHGLLELACVWVGSTCLSLAPLTPPQLPSAFLALPIPNQFPQGMG